jgi:hypothetical protein
VAEQPGVGRCNYPGKDRPSLLLSNQGGRSRGRCVHELAKSPEGRQPGCRLPAHPPAPRLATVRAHLRRLAGSLLPVPGRPRPAVRGQPCPDQPRAVKDYAACLAVKERMSVSTQNQAFSAPLFMCREVLRLKLGDLSGNVRGKRGRRLPAALSEMGARPAASQVHDRDLRPAAESRGEVVGADAGVHVQGPCGGSE